MEDFVTVGLVVALLIILGIVIVPLLVGWSICWFAKNIFFMEVNDTLWNIWLLGFFIEAVLGTSHIDYKKE